MHVAGEGDAEELTCARCRKSVPLPKKRRTGNGKHLTVVGARANNLKDLTVEIPLAKLVWPLPIPMRPVPTDPVTEARGQVMIQEGRDPFFEDSVPRAIIRLRQGIGRLIRHRYDRGYAVICDGRIIRRSYGRAFISSLGDVQPVRKNLEPLRRDVESFLFKKMENRK